MRVKAICILLLVFGTQFCQANDDFVTLRETVKKSVADSKTAFTFYETMKALDTKNKPILIGYKAMSELLLCKHVISPISKLSHFKRGRVLLEQAISEDMGNAELRFYRYCTQLNVPGMLNYSGNLKEDKAFLLSFLAAQSKKPKKDVDLYVRIKSFLLTSKHATAQDKEDLKSI